MKEEHFQVNNHTVVVCLILLVICDTILTIISSKVKSGVGCIIFAQANVRGAEIGIFCLVQANGLVIVGVTRGDCGRIDISNMVFKDGYTPEGIWLKSGKDKDSVLYSMKKTK